jgi:hypothetical protein
MCFHHKMRKSHIAFKVNYDEIKNSDVDVMHDVTPLS